MNILGRNYFLRFLLYFPILSGMKWLEGAVAGGLLVAFGYFLRWLLDLDKPGARRPSGWVHLTADREAAYQSVALEVESRASIVGVSLNDAMEEREAGHLEIAKRLVGLAFCEWGNLAQIVAELLNTLPECAPTALALFPLRNIAFHRFRSHTMVDYARMHEVLDQFVFRSKPRFQVHIRLLRRAEAVLTGEFGRSYHRALRADGGSNELWRHLDLCFHDFDLITKETLLVLRAFLLCLPDEEVEAFAVDLRALAAHGVRALSAVSR